MTATTFRRLDHRRRPVRHRTGLPGSGRAAEQDHRHLGATRADGGTWDLFRYPGVRSDSDMYTFGYSFRPWRDVKVLADGPSIREYVAETAAEFGIDDKIHYGAEGRQRGLVQYPESLDGDHPARGERRNTHLHLRLSHQLHGLLQLRRGLPADVPRCGSVRGSVRSPAALAGRTWTTQARRSSSSAVAQRLSPWSRRWPATPSTSRCCSAPRRTSSRCPRSTRSPSSLVGSCRSAGCTRSRASGTSPSSDTPIWPAAAGRLRCAEFCSGWSDAASAPRST